MSDLPVDIQLKSNVHRRPHDVQEVILVSCALKIKFLCPKCSRLKLARFLIMKSLSFVKILLINCSKSIIGQGYSLNYFLYLNKC